MVVEERKGQAVLGSIHGPGVTCGSSFLLYLIRRIFSWAFTGIQTKKLIERSWERGCFLLFLLQRAEKPTNKKLKQATKTSNLKRNSDCILRSGKSKPNESARVRLEGHAL